MYKIDRRGGGQKSYTRTDPKSVSATSNHDKEILFDNLKMLTIHFPHAGIHGQNQ